MTRHARHIPVDNSTLHLPRILCLHGGGTNARIFHAQCRALEQALRPWFRLCYAEGIFPSQPGSDVTAVYRDFGPFRAWIDPTDTNPRGTSEALHKSIAQAIAEDNRQHATGPFVGLLGFSQGAKVCASLILEQQLMSRGGSARGIEGCGVNSFPRWRFAVLLAGCGPLVTLSPQSVEADLFHRMGSLWENDGSDRQNDPKWPKNLVLTRELIQVPTIHVHGIRDPNLDLHQKLLYEYFDLRYTQLVEWDGEHRVPLKAKDVNALVEEINSLWPLVML
ncbi:hypothetical protein N7537_010686 [Penicillium hordei]|uniref:Serine hydrolase domain-containing protein n=1 Tax=Penicillium hordei TaxID=40994 RepID=A0AAD6DVC8_9EURO|nr:uncharacterized protein N7537_010686 [Penicillium hordei]KAJ5593782.1 hypothetical protein N7537_010686 [Penicillium hordei]